MAVMYNSNFDETNPFSDTCFQLALATTTVLSITIPGTAINKYTAHFAYTQDSNVFVRKNTTVAIPGAGLATTQEYNEFKPGFDGSKRYVQGGDVLYFITPDTSAYVGVSLMSLPM